MKLLIYRTGVVCLLTFPNCFLKANSLSCVVAEVSVPLSKESPTHMSEIY